MLVSISHFHCRFVQNSLPASSCEGSSFQTGFFFFLPCTLETTGEIREPSSRVISRINFRVTKRSRPCGHWRGRESALRRPRCYCRLGGAKSRTNRPTTHRVEPPSRVASLNCLASTWNFHVGATETCRGRLVCSQNSAWKKKLQTYIISNVEKM